MWQHAGLESFGRKTRDHPRRPVTHRQGAGDKRRRGMEEIEPGKLLESRQLTVALLVGHGENAFFGGDVMESPPGR